MLCLDENRMIGKTFIDSGLEVEKQHFHKIDREVLDTGISNVCEEKLTIGDKTRTIITKKNRFIDESGDRFLVGSIHDITEIRYAEKELEKYRLHLETLVKTRTAELTKKNSDLKKEKLKVEEINKELESFSYSVSHDLRAPLRHIDGFASLLQKKIKSKLDQKEESYFNNIIESSLKMNQLIDGLLSYSKMGRTELKRTTINMKTLVDKAMQIFVFDIKKRNISIIVEAMPDASVDNFLMVQVWENLISNAIKFCGNTKHPKIHIGYDKDSDGNAIYFIKDNGAGFNQNYVEKVFGVFQRLHSINEFPGTGIGMATAKRIVTKHGGQIWAEGQINKGASFYFKLPFQVQCPK
jgi:light-regulated signal transduction histidine kinase (bacteriophytochrome)